MKRKDTTDGVKQFELTDIPAFLYYHYVAVFCLFMKSYNVPVFCCLYTCTQLLLFMFGLVYFVGLCYCNLGSKPEDTFNLVRCLDFSAIWDFFSFLILLS